MDDMEYDSGKDVEEKNIKWEKSKKNKKGQRLFKRQKIVHQNDNIF